MPSVLDPAIELLYEADRDTYGSEYDLRIREAQGSRPEFRIRLDRREYQRSLSRLIDLAREAHRSGDALHLSL